MSFALRHSKVMKSELTEQVLDLQRGDDLYPFHKKHPAEHQPVESMTA